MANRITTILDLDNRGLVKSLKSVRRSVAETEGGFNKMKVGAAGLGAALKANVGAAAVGAGAALVAFGAKSVQAASRLAESSNAVSKSFGTAAQDVLKVGENSAESFGLSKSAFNEAAVAFASFAKTVSGGRNTAGVIEDLTQRAADFASVMNIDVAEAATVFRSGLSGETEPLKRFGIDLSAAAVESHALAKGLVASKSEMTEAIKVQARYSLLMESTAQFAGDFADTSDGLANSSRTLSAKIEDLSAKFGEELTPQIEGAVGVAIALVDALAAIKDFTGPGFGQFFGDDIAKANAEREAMFADMALSAEERTRREEAQQKRIAAAYIQNQRGYEAYVRSVKESDLAETYKDHADGMVRESERMADELAGDLERLTEYFESFREEIANDEALLDLEEGWEDVEAAATEAYLKAVDGADDAKQASRDYQRSINDQKLKVLDFIDTLEGVPLEKRAEILAMIDQGKFREAERALNALAAGRTVAFRAQVFGAEIARDQLRRAGMPNAFGATGGIVTRPTAAVIGEAGPEAVIPLNRTPGSSPLPANLGAAPNVYMTVHVAPGAGQIDFERAVVEAFKKFTRRNGPGSVGL